MTYVQRGPRAYGISVRTDRWRYTRWSDGAVELYDHTQDTGEWHNVAGQPENADLLKRLAALLPK